MAELKKGRVVVSENVDSIAEQGFGEVEAGKLVLAPFEALYLLEKRKIEVMKGRKKLDFAQLMKELKKKSKGLEEIYAVFRELRVAGYVARDAKAKVPCLRVYQRGVRPEEEPSRNLIWIISPKAKLSVKEIMGIVDKSHAVRKRAVLAVVGKDITYFKIDSTRF